MKKEFNDTGLCVPNKHYMVDTIYQLKETIELIEKGKYFIINRPRQFGKTTTLACLNRYYQKQDDYLPIKLSFEKIDDSEFESFEKFAPALLNLMGNQITIKTKGLSDVFKSRITDDLNTQTKLSNAITNIISELDKKVILFIDEVDQASNNKLFLNFLAMLREKYLETLDDSDYTFHSVVLAGLHDVKNLKLKLRTNEEETYNSPWNIAVSYDVDMTFKAKQIETMLVDYVSATKRSYNKSDSSPDLDIAFIAEKLYYHTSGYPYFVSKLCKIIDEKIKPEVWTELDIIEAIKILLAEENNPNFDKVIKILEENKNLTVLIKKISFGLESISYNSKVPLINFGEMHGIFRPNEKNRTVIFNKLYDKVISEYFESKQEIENNLDLVSSLYLKPDGRLDLKILLTKYKDAVEEKYSSAKSLKSKEFLEDDLRMQFFMYLKPVLNGVGFCCKEVQTSEERRMDVLIFFRDEKFIIELKIWKGTKLHEEGIKQIKNYMQKEHVNKGYMLILNKNKTKEFKTTDEDGIFTAWV